MTKVHDNAARHRFELAVEGATAFIDYRRKAGVVTMTHAEVPEALSGKGAWLPPREGRARPRARKWREGGPALLLRRLVHTEPSRV